MRLTDFDELKEAVIANAKVRKMVTKEVKKKEDSNSMLTMYLKH